MRTWRIFDHDAAHAKQPDFNPLDGVGGLHGYAGVWHYLVDREAKPSPCRPQRGHAV